MLGTAKHVRTNSVTSGYLPPAFRWKEVFQIPALLIVTPLFSDVDPQWFHHIPELKVHIWEEHGHFLFAEDPTRFNQEVEDFFAEHHLLEN